MSNHSAASYDAVVVVSFGGPDKREDVIPFLENVLRGGASLLALGADLDPNVAELAAMVLDVARVKPYKRRRLKVRATQRKDLLAKLEQSGLILAHHSEATDTRRNLEETLLA